MTKSELIESIAKKYPNLGMKDIKNLVDLVFSEFTNFLVKGNRIEVRGFGTMSVRNRKARTSRNPKTCEIIPLGDRNIIYFRMGKEFFNKLNPINSNVK